MRVLTLCPCCSCTDKEVRSFAAYKMYLLFFGFVVAMYEKVFKVRLCVCDTSACLPVSLSGLSFPSFLSFLSVSQSTFPCMI